jgi:ribonuclease HI
MTARPSLAALLRAIAEEEPLERTLARFPGVDRAQLEALLLEAAGAPARRHPRGEGVRRPTQEGLPLRGHRWIRVASDGAARGNPGPAGAGAVLFDADGKVIERLGQFLGKETNNVAEYMGLLLGVRRAAELGAEELEVMADSELMIRQLSGVYQVRSPVLRRLHAEAMALLKGFRRVKLLHVPRAKNAEADEMSNRAIDERM